MKLKVKVEKVFEKSCNGKNGTFVRRAILDENTKEWFSASADQWNFKPEQGAEYEIEYQKNGTYNNIVFPGKARMGAGSGGFSDEQFKTIVEKLDKQIELLTKMSAPITPLQGQSPFPEEECEIKGQQEQEDDVPY